MWVGSLQHGKKLIIHNGSKERVTREGKERREEWIPSQNKTRGPQRLRWRRGSQNPKRRSTAGETSGRAQDPGRAAPSEPPRPHAETPRRASLHTRRPGSLCSKPARGSSRRCGSNKKRRTRHQRTRDTAPKQNPPEPTPLCASRWGKWPGIGMNDKGPVGNSEGIHCRQVIWVQQGKNAGHRGSRLPERRIQRWKRKWTGGASK